MNGAASKGHLYGLRGGRVITESEHIVLVGAKVKVKADIVGEQGFPKRGVECDLLDIMVVVRIPRLVFDIRCRRQLS
jgi:hypothetical protein